MNAVTEQIDRQADERYRRAETRNSNEERTDSSIHNEARGAQIIQTNTHSTPVMVLLVIMSLMTATAIGIAVNANYTSFLAERRAALANNHADVATAKVQHLEDVMTIRGIIIPPRVMEKEDVE